MAYDSLTHEVRRSRASCLHEDLQLATLIEIGELSAQHMCRLMTRQIAINTALLQALQQQSAPATAAMRLQAQLREQVQALQAQVTEAGEALQEIAELMQDAGVDA